MTEADWYRVRQRYGDRDTKSQSYKEIDREKVRNGDMVAFRTEQGLTKRARRDKESKERKHQ